MINVFLASSSKFITGKSAEATTLTFIISGLEKCEPGNIKITTWWNCAALKTGFILSALDEVIDSYDMGIFVYGKDIHEQSKDWPNHNVIAELAMFHTAGKGMFVLCEDPQIEIPSDFKSINYALFSDTEGIRSGFKKALDDLKHPKDINSYGKCCVYYNPDLSHKYIKFNAPLKINKPPEEDLKEWESRALYVGTRSAYLWNAIEGVSTYPEHLAISRFTSSKANRRWDTDSKINSLDEIDINNVVSFGPGIGSIDETLIHAFLPAKPCYIPVDMNVSLAIESMSVMGRTNDIPFAIIDDFEENACYTKLSPILESNKRLIGSNNLFSMLGVTFSNLSMTCDDFFYSMKGLMKDEKDYLLLDVIIYDGLKKEKKISLNESIRKDILEKIAKNSGFWNLIQNSIRKKGLKKCPKPQNLVIDFFNTNALEYQRRTTIPETKIAFIQHENNIITIAKYYKYESFKKEIRQHFDLVASAKYPDLSRGVFLLQKKNNEDMN